LSQFEAVAVFADGQCGENAASFETETEVGYVLALESDGNGTEEEDIDIAVEEGADGFPAVDAALIEQQVRRDALMQEVVLVQGGRAPDGWRIDRFPRADGTVRLVPTPPWSRRVPNMEPEDWIATNKRVQNVLREDWKSEDPENYNAQERRRAAWLRAKAERRGIPPVAMAIATPQKKRTRGKGSPPSPSDRQKRSRGARADTPGRAVARDPLPLRVECKILAGEVEMVFIELGCEEDSELSAAVREKCFAVRITQRYDLTQRGTKGAIHGIIQLCHLYGIELHVWVSIPCTAVRGSISMTS